MEKGLKQLKHLNKILIIFFAFSFLTIFAGWRFIQSRNFSDKASKKVSEILTKKFGAKLSFTGVDFSIFPPSTIFKNVHIEKNDPSVANIELDVEKLSVSFTYSSFFSSDLKIDDLALENGALKIITSKTETPDINWKELNTSKVFEKYTDILKKSPLQLNVARITNLNIQLDESSFLLNALSFAPHYTDVLFSAKASQIFIDHKLKLITPFNLDRGEFVLSLTSEKWIVESLHLENKQNKIDLNAEIFNRQSTLQVNTNSKFDMQIESLTPFFPSLPKEYASLKGNIVGRMSSRGDLENPDAELTLEAKQFKSEWIELQNIKTVLKKKKNILIVEKFNAQNINERYELLKSQSIFDTDKKVFLPMKVPLYLKEAFTNTFLYSLKDSLEPLKGYLTGKIEVVWNGEKVFFEIRERATLKDFKLLSVTKTPILQNEGIGLQETFFSLDKNYKLGINAKLIMNNSLVKAIGEIDGKELNISIKDSKLDMKSLGPISGLALSGSGPFNAEIYGPFDNVKFDFIVDWNNFSVIDLNFGRIKSEFRLSLKDLDLNIYKLNGVFNQSIFSAEGKLNFGNSSGLDIKLDFTKTNFSDARKMYGLIFRNIKLPLDTDFNFSSAYSVKGGFDIDKLTIDGKIKGSELRIFNEEAERLSLDFKLQKSLLHFQDIKIRKSRGIISAGVVVNLANNYTELEGSAQGLRLHDFNFYRGLNISYDGDLLVDFEGNGTTGNFSSRFKTKLNNTFIENIPTSPSSAIVYLNTDEVAVNANLFSGKIKLDSSINFKSRQVNINSRVETIDMREVLGVVAGHNISDKNISGKIKAQLISKFNIDTFFLSKFFLDFSSFSIKKGDINLSVDPIHNYVFIEDGAVKSWDLRFLDREDFFISKAKNLQSGGVVFDQSFSLKTGFLEFLSNSVDKAMGVIKGTNQVVVDKKISIPHFQIKGIKNSFKIKNVPGVFTDLEFAVAKKGETFELTRFNGNFGEGEFKATGKVVFDDLYPTVNIDYRIDRSTIPLFKKSSLLVSSAGTITGTELPYKLNGKLSLLYGEFLDDPADFTKVNKVNLESYKKYLPQKGSAEKRGYLNLNVAFDTVNPILVKNNLAEVYAKGIGQINGDILDPEINARIEIVPTLSKFKFKGHDFILNQGFVDLRDKGKARVSDLKFAGLAKINDYDVRLDITGSIEKSNINLSSEPPLAQEDLLSLLTLGVTSDMSKNLEASDRKSVTTVGLGTLLVDQLKINEDLSSTLGLNLSVLPEFKEDESSLITGKSAVSENGTSKLKTATKIKIKKQINKLVNVSVSSTVGGSIEQTQEMNVNFNINKNFSIEGVYEMKPSEEENTNTPNSIGADLKYRRSF